MGIIDILFPVLGTTIPTDHLYMLYGALTQQVSAFHNGTVPLHFAPIAGQHGGRGLLWLSEFSRLRIRLPAAEIPVVLPLAGKGIVLGEQRVRLGVPHVQALSPTPALAARLVTFKHATEPEQHLRVARQRLDVLGVKGKVEIPSLGSGPRKGEPMRRVLRIRGKRVIGYALRVADLAAEESMLLQESGLGGRRRMGCGFFLPTRNGEGIRNAL